MPHSPSRLNLPALGLSWAGLTCLGWLGLGAATAAVWPWLTAGVSPAADAVIQGAGLLLIGAGVAGLQWLVLRRYLADAARWILAGAVGMLVATLVAAPLQLQDLYVAGTQFELDELAFGAVFGGLLGVAQWWALRGPLRETGWWIVGSGAGWFLGMAGAEFLALGWPPPRSAALYTAVTVAVPALVTGAVLAFLLSGSRPRPAPPVSAPPS